MASTKRSIQKTAPHENELTILPVAVKRVADTKTELTYIEAIERIEKQQEEIKYLKQQIEADNLHLYEAQDIHNDFPEIIGTGQEMQKVLQLISQVASSDATVLLHGETGTGKEVIARAIHNASARKDNIMIKVNCAAIPANLIESELFGHEKGSFTGATDRRIGKFELANKSTLFLDEIGELPWELQAKLLRVLQEKEIERVGGKGAIKINVRIIAATNKNLEKEAENGKFRSDLYYRLNVFPIILPALRHRKDDIPALASHFIAHFARNTGKKITGLSKKALEELSVYSWPGNVRELEHLIERSVLLSSGPTMKKIFLPDIHQRKTINSPDEFIILPLEQVEKEYILKVIKKCNGRISGPQGAATKMGLPATTLISKMQKLGIKKEHGPDSKQQ